MRNFHYFIVFFNKTIDMNENNLYLYTFKI